MQIDSSTKSFLNHSKGTKLLFHFFIYFLFGGKICHCNFSCSTRNIFFTESLQKCIQPLSFFSFPFFFFPSFFSVKEKRLLVEHKNFPHEINCSRKREVEITIILLLILHCPEYVCLCGCMCLLITREETFDRYIEGLGIQDLFNLKEI